MSAAKADLPAEMACAMWRGIDDVRLERQPLLAPGGREVLVRVAACGICGTDLHLVDGSIPLYTPPRVLGHEMSGTVVAVGPEVRSVDVGAVVTIDPNLPCGACFFCREAQPYMCVRRVPAIGGFAEYILVPEQTVYPLPPGVPVEHGALTEPLSCCVHATELANIRAGGTVAIVGAGTIGLLLLQLAKRNGAALVAVSEPDSGRRALAERLGADVTVNPRAEDLHERLRAATGGIGVDVAFEAVGSAPTIQAAISLPRRGGTVVLVGVAPGTAEITLRPYDLFERELTIRASFIRAYEFRRAVELLSVLEIEPMLGTRYPLDRIHDAFEAAGSRQGVKTLVIPWATA
ncbi:MAG: alcohol dehydrogenase catalytic domain-containing protein [Chloroflexi bacterium]|nr:alcohol dehydrogenase catalytic domain-containing protein [Chloroflexota bacterium]